MIYSVPLSELRDHARDLVRRGIRGSTAKTYSVAQKRYLDFCASYGLEALPASESTLLNYVAFLDKEGLKSSSMRVYLSSIRALHIDEGLGNPLDKCLQLSKALKGLDIAAAPATQKLPITLDVLSKLKSQLLGDYDSSIHWCAMTVAFFGCLRCSELVNLLMSDCSFRPVNNECCAVLNIRQSKTDKKNAGFNIYLCCTGRDVCGLCAILQLQALRAASSVQLFVLSDGSALTKRVFVEKTKALLNSAGFNPANYSGHSFRSGSATTAALCGLSDHEIKLLGRWSSCAYQRYIRAPDSLLASFSKRLVHADMATVSDHSVTFCKNLFLS